MMIYVRTKIFFWWSKSRTCIKMEAVQFIHDENTPTDALLLTENKISVSRLFCMPYLSGILFVSDLRFKHDKTIYGYLIKRGALKFFFITHRPYSADV